MPEIKQLTRQKLITLSVDLGEGDSLNLSFDRNKITPAWMAEAQRRDDDLDTASLPKALAEVIVAWDVTDDGADFPPTAEHLSVFSYPVQASLLQQILTASIPSSEEGNVSSDTSAEQASVFSSQPENLQNGLTPSLSPAPSESPSPT